MSPSKHDPRHLRSLVVCVLLGILWFQDHSALAARRGTLRIRVLDEATGKPVACRMHLTNAADKPVKPRGFPAWDDHFVFNGEATLRLAEGAYRFVIERGPEYARSSGHFQMSRTGDDAHTVRLRRIVDMANQGWWSGDLHIHRDLKDVELLAAAEDLHVAPVITWWNKRNLWARGDPPSPSVQRLEGPRIVDRLAGEDERGGGALLFFGLDRPLEIASSRREFPSSATYLQQAKEAGAWADAEKPFWWDYPLWLATGLVDSVGIANNHQQRRGMLDNEAWGKPRDDRRFPSPCGNGLWTQHIYYQTLNAGFRIPPSAGSASGVLANPVGYNRIYVFTGDDLTSESWWEGFRRGRVIVTNGPLLRPLVSGKLPGHLFTAAAGQRLQLDLSLHLSLRESGGYLEVVKNGEIERSLRLDEWAKDGSLAPVEFDESGWFLIRVVTDHPSTYRFASTGPYYVQIGESGIPVRRESAQFFLDWARERHARLERASSDPESGDFADEQQRADVLSEHQRAIDFWEKRTNTQFVRVDSR